MTIGRKLVLLVCVLIAISGIMLAVGFTATEALGGRVRFLSAESMPRQLQIAHFLESVKQASDLAEQLEKCRTTAEIDALRNTIQHCAGEIKSGAAQIDLAGENGSAGRPAKVANGFEELAQAASQRVTSLALLAVARNEVAQSQTQALKLTSSVEQAMERLHRQCVQNLLDARITSQASQTLVKNIDPLQLQPAQFGQRMIDAAESLTLAARVLEQASAVPQFMAAIAADSARLAQAATREERATARDRIKLVLEKTRKAAADMGASLAKLNDTDAQAVLAKSNEALDWMSGVLLDAERGMGVNVERALGANEHAVQLAASLRAFLTKLSEAGSEQLRRAETSQADQAREADNIAHACRMALIACGIFALCAGTGVGIWTGRSITRSLAAAISTLSGVVAQILEHSAQAAFASQDTANRATENAAALEQTSSAMTQLSASTQRNANGAQTARDSADRAHEAVQSGAGTVATMTQAMEQIKQASSEVSTIIKSIDEIAFKTNLLALNAAVEAAHAGDAGNGFNVVAEEVRRLSRQAAESAKASEYLIGTSLQATMRGAETVRLVETALDQVKTNVKCARDLVTEIAGACHEQAIGIGQVNSAVQEMDSNVQGAAKTAEDSATMAEQISSQARELSGVVTQLQRIVGAKSSLELPITLVKRQLNGSSGSLRPAAWNDDAPRGQMTNSRRTRSMKFTSLFLVVLVAGLAEIGAMAADGAPELKMKPVERFAEIEQKELVKLIAERKVVLIDCNGTDSFKSGHIPGAIDFEADGADLSKKLPADKGALIVAYCGSEFCPAYKEGAEAAAKLGYSNVKHYRPGISGWLNSGEKVEKDEK